MRTRRSVGAGLGASLLAPARAAATAFAWPGGARAAVSLSYDDALDSQIVNAVPALAAAGLKATFFLTKDNVGPALDGWVGVARAGHEIGNHTITHPCDLQTYSAASFARKELIPMEAWLDANFGKGRPRLYAYPCSMTDLGEGSPNVQRGRYEGLLRSLGFRAARYSDEDDPNTPAHALAHPYRLRSSATTYDADDPAMAIAYVQEAIRRGAWAILVFHGIVPRRTGDGETSIATHSAVLSWLKAQPVWCAPIGQVLGALPSG
ncbi:MAG TPA: polysaccharide deacetylase family protein [Caulobacteraceae bacterium]|nr:polysaccharide deacetylase family protein [Caulobacteraceae bacterium]